MELTPPNSGRRSEDDVRYQLGQLESKMDGQHKRVGDRLDDVEADCKEIRERYVTEKTLSLHLKNIDVTLVNIKELVAKGERAVNWIVGLIIASFIGAVARIVYVSTK